MFLLTYLLCVRVCQSADSVSKLHKTKQTAK